MHRLTGEYIYVPDNTFSRSPVNPKLDTIYVPVNVFYFFTIIYQQIFT